MTYKLRGMRLGLAPKFAPMKEPPTPQVRCDTRRRSTDLKLAGFVITTTINMLLQYSSRETAEEQADCFNAIGAEAEESL